MTTETLNGNEEGEADRRLRKAVAEAEKERDARLAAVLRMRATEPLYGLTQEQHRTYQLARDAGKTWVAKYAWPSELVGLECEILRSAREINAFRLSQFICDYFREHWEWAHTWEKLLHRLIAAMKGTSAGDDRAAAEHLSAMWGITKALDGWRGDGPFMETEFGDTYPFELAGFLEGALHLWLKVKNEVVVPRPGEPESIFFPEGES